MAEKQKRRWAIPSKRAKSYAEERKSKVHHHGKKEGQELTVYECGLRSGYLQCQYDHAGIYNYKKKKAEEAAAKEQKKSSKK